ncbi:MAG: YggS family pyridoxal phosphate-dependent enzyme [Clostridia bacterium]|nr:YggS family pyridoxal phosphate-dependent enzyme [Clostridia bacterium]
MITNSCNDSVYIDISENIKVIKSSVAEAAIKSGRSPEDVRLMAVTKTVSVDKINYALDNCGIDLIGENKVQEFLSKKDELHLEAIEKHLIGHLQTNKVKKILPFVDMIQSVDSVHLAEAINKAAANLGITAKVLLEVNIGGEDSKTGFDKGAFINSLHEISQMSSLCVKGLMTIPPICDDDLLLEKYFADMHDYYNEIKEMNLPNFDFDILSMGMSGDFYQAILHGSNLVRVGSAIFGARIYK